MIMKPSERIWIIEIDDGDFVWCDCPDPADDVDEDDVTEYVLATKLKGAEYNYLGACEDIKHLETKLKKAEKQTARGRKTLSNLADDYENVMEQLAVLAEGKTISPKKWAKNFRECCLAGGELERARNCIKGIKDEVCEHDKKMNDYCFACGRINGG